ncbi:MAG: glutathione S-transferase family protein [Deltaproteobacteria bacterium]|nr:glutathione S-transferase family protein [Deltaproteobacteria bacterium]MDD9853014.1 glutathione S-transferase family protein [Deltaproteobacteria bacterium]
MKFYDSVGPNPKLVRMFAAEKGYQLPDTEKVDIVKGENRQEPYLLKNPAGQLPALTLDDGRTIAETTAICEWMEEQQPEPPLIGASAADRAETRMWTRRVEWLVVQPLTAGFRSGMGVKMFQDRMRLFPESADALIASAGDGLAWLNEQINGRETIVPGRFTLADIALYAFLEFGAQVGQPVDSANANIAAWFERTGARPSAQA